MWVSCQDLSGFLLLLALLLAAGISQAEAAGADGGEEPKQNSVELFVGGTFDSGEGDLSLGAIYVRRFGEKLGVGALAERTDSPGREWVFAVPFFWHVVDPWKVLIAPGIERANGNNEYMTRLGASYEFEFDGWTLAPELNFDFVDSEMKTVVGVSFGSTPFKSTSPLNGRSLQLFFFGPWPKAIRRKGPDTQLPGARVH
jgi:hypothetical protein